MLPVNATTKDGKRSFVVYPLPPHAPRLTPEAYEDMIKRVKGAGGWYSWAVKEPPRPAGLAFWQPISDELVQEYMRPWTEAEPTEPTEPTERVRPNRVLAAIEKRLAYLAPRCDGPTHTDKKRAWTNTCRSEAAHLRDLIPHAHEAPTLDALKALHPGNWVDVSNGYHGYRAYQGLHGHCTDWRMLRDQQVRAGIPGYFPTPPELATELCQGIKPTDIVLEPSAGCGELVQAALDAGAAHVYAVEYNPGLCEVLRTRFADEKRVSVHCEDVLSMAKLQGVTRIVMNPPFEKNQDIRHVRHMFDTYDVPIRAITSAHWTFADDKASLEMRLLFPGPYDIRENAFATAQRRTSVSIAVVHIDPEDL